VPAAGLPSHRAGVVRPDGTGVRPFGRAIDLYREYGSALAADGIDAGDGPGSRPDGLAEAVLVVRLCERFGCLPDALLAQPLEFWRMVQMADRFRGEGE
jgi:hypothetical protein